MGYGLCVEEAPMLFVVDADTGQVRLLAQDQLELHVSAARAAAQVCPQRALRLADDGPQTMG